MDLKRLITSTFVLILIKLTYLTYILWIISKFKNLLQQNIKSIETLPYEHFILEEQIYMTPMNKFIPVATLGIQFREDWTVD